MLYAPAAQSVQALTPPGENEPVAHRGHAVCPVADEYAPARQVGHTARPVPVPYRPVGHEVQPLAPEPEYAPAGHAAHAPAPEADLEVPAAHAEQALWPAADVKYPARQLTHTAELTPASAVEAVPAGHSVQVPAVRAAV